MWTQILQPRSLIVPVLLFAAMSCRTAAPRSEWSDTVWIRSGQWQVGVSPSAGRIVHLSRSDEPNLLRIHSETANQTHPPPGRWDWLDYGGDWLWPVAQEDWIRLGTEYFWPPPNAFEYRPWFVTRGEQDGPWLLMELQVQEPLHVVIRRRIHLPDQHPDQLWIEQSIERTAPSDIPVCLWQVAQLHPLAEIRMDRRADSLLPEGFFIIDGDDQTPKALAANADQVVFTCGTVRGKIGTDGDWIEVKGLRISVSNPVGGLSLPDGGCSVALAYHPDKPYVEIESMSPRWDLRVSESVTNLLIYQ